MSEPIKSEQKDSVSTDLGQVLARIIREAVKQELNSCTTQNPMDEADFLMTVEQAAKMLNVSEDWLYDRAKTFPFTIKLGPKMLRFSVKGLQKYLTRMQVRC